MMGMAESNIKYLVIAQLQELLQKVRIHGFTSFCCFNPIYGVALWMKDWMESKKTDLLCETLL